MSTNIAEMYERFVATPFPQLGYSVGNFPLYDAIVAGGVSSYLQGAIVDPAAIEPPDEETQAEVSALTAKPVLSVEEQYFLEYFEALEELRLALRQRVAG